jgi:hypothetical protein
MPVQINMLSPHQNHFDIALIMDQNYSQHNSTLPFVLLPTNIQIFQKNAHIVLARLKLHNYFVDVGDMNVEPCCETG